jgi:hypothetical protein
VTSRAGLDEDTRLPWVGFRIVIPAEEMIEFPVSKDAAPGTRTETPPPDKQERP